MSLKLKYITHYTMPTVKFESTNTDGGCSQNWPFSYHRIQSQNYIQQLADNDLLFQIDKRLADNRIIMRFFVYEPLKIKTAELLGL